MKKPTSEAVRELLLQYASLGLNIQDGGTVLAGDPKIRTAIPRFIISLSFVIVSLLLCWFGLNDERPRVRAALFVSAFASLGFGLFVWWSLLL